MLVVAFTWGGTVGTVSSFIRGAEESVLPVIGKVGGSVNRVTAQLDKIDRISTGAQLRAAGT